MLNTCEDAPRLSAPQEEKWTLLPLLRQLGAACCGALGSSALLYGTFAPLGVGLTLGMPQDCALSAALGAAAVLFLHAGGSRAVGQLAAMTAGAVTRRLCPKRIRAAYAAACAAWLAAALCFRPLEGVQGILIACSDAALAVGFAAGMHRIRAETPELWWLPPALAAVCALAELRLGPASAGLCVCGAASLLTACRGEKQQAALAAAVLGAGACAADQSLLPAALGMQAGTLAAAQWASGDKLPCTVLYGLGCLTGALCAETPEAALTALQLQLSAALVFILIPRQFCRPASVPPDPADCTDRPRLASAATRLGAVAESLTDLADTVNDVCAAIPRRTEGYRWVIDNTHDSLCANCGRREECWQNEYAVTMDGMLALRAALEEKECVGPEDLPGQLSRCVHPAALSAAVTRSFALYRSRQEARIHAEAMRTALTEQYGAVAQALSVLADQLGEPGTPEPYKSGRVAELFTSLGMPPLECTVTLDRLGRTRAAVTLHRTRFSEAELDTLAREAGRLCRRSFDPPQKLSCRGMTTLLFAEKPQLRVIFGAAGAAARGEVSGDAVQQFCSPSAAQMILCDGMGTGRPAAVDGNLAAELTARLLKAGFTAELAARLVNVALALKSEEEGGATLDLISVDLYTGTARLYKAGAAPGFIVHGGKARAVGEASLPIGVLGAVNGQSRIVQLAAGDVALLASDGLLVDGCGWVLQQLELSAAAGESAGSIARTLVQMARARAERTGRPDDITAAVLRVENV